MNGSKNIKVARPLEEFKWCSTFANQKQHKKEKENKSNQDCIYIKTRLELQPRIRLKGMEAQSNAAPLRKELLGGA